MKNIDDLLNEVQTKSDWTSDYKIGRGLGYSHTTQVSSWRRRLSMPNVVDIVKMADHAGLDLAAAVRAVAYSKENERPLKLAQAGMSNVIYLSTLATSSMGLLSLSRVTTLEQALLTCGIAGVAYASLYIIRNKNYYFAE